MGGSQTAGAPRAGVWGGHPLPVLCGVCPPHEGRVRRWVGAGRGLAGLGRGVITPREGEQEPRAAQAPWEGRQPRPGALARSLRCPARCPGAAHRWDGCAALDRCSSTPPAPHRRDLQRAQRCPSKTDQLPAAKQMT